MEDGMGQGGVRFFLDEDGVLAAEGVPDAWRAFFEDDVQGDELACERILAAVEAVRAGERREWSASGNVHTLTLTPQGAVVSCHWTVRRGALAGY